MRQNMQIYTILAHIPYDFMPFALSLVRPQVLRVAFPILNVDYWRGRKKERKRRIRTNELGL